MDLSIVIVNWNTRELLRQCLETLPDSAAGLEYEVLVVDNASIDSSPEMIASGFPSVQLIRNSSNRGFAVANNQAMEVARGRHLLLLNSDTIPAPGSIAKLVDFLDKHREVGIVGPRLLNGDGTLQASWAAFPTFLSEVLGKNFRQRRECRTASGVVAYDVDSVGGACLLIRGEALASVGPLDDRFFMYCEEIDWCYRVRQHGWRVCYTPEAQVVHLGGRSSMQAAAPMKAELYRSKLKFFQKHYGLGSAAILASLLTAKFLMKVVYGLAARTLRLEPNATRGSSVRDGVMLVLAIGDYVRRQWRLRLSNARHGSAA